MQPTKLYTTDGQYLAIGQIVLPEEGEPLPKLLQWGARYFAFDETSQKYQEVPGTIVTTKDIPVTSIYEVVPAPGSEGM